MYQVVLSPRNLLLIITSLYVLQARSEGGGALFSPSVDVFSVAPAILLPCDTTNTAQKITIDEPIGVIGSSGVCLCAADGTGVGLLTFATCEGAGPIHALEINFKLPDENGFLSWSTNLCATATATAGVGNGSSSSTISLASCSPSTSIVWKIDAVTQHVIDTNSSMCLTVGTPPPPPPSLFASVFGDDMILQRDVSATVWGTTAVGALVNVTFMGLALVSLPADAAGRWSLDLPPTPAGNGPYNITASSSSSSSSTQTLARVLFGDLVWCSGQSNLDSANTPVSYAFNATAEIAAASLFSSWVRLFKVGKAQSTTPLSDLSTAPALVWSPAAPTTVAHFSATCWFHGRDLAVNLGSSIPIGLIESAWGGTSIQPWSSPGLSNDCGDFPSYPGGWPTIPQVLYNAMTFPFQGMKMSGIVWYQGGERGKGIFKYVRVCV